MPNRSVKRQFKIDKLLPFISYAIYGIILLEQFNLSKSNHAYHVLLQDVWTWPLNLALTLPVALAFWAYRDHPLLQKISTILIALLSLIIFAVQSLLFYGIGCGKYTLSEVKHSPNQDHVATIYQQLCPMGDQEFTLALGNHSWLGLKTLFYCEDCDLRNVHWLNNHTLKFQSNEQYCQYNLKNLTLRCQPSKPY